MEPTDNLFQEFQAKVLGLQGLYCSGVKGGFGVGSMIWIMFGELHTLTIHLKDGRSVSIEDAKRGVNVHFAAWRLETPDKIVCSSSSINDIDGPMDDGFALLRGRRLEHVSLRGIALDLELEFSGGIRLLIFCDQCHQKEERDNYEVGWDDTLYVVGSNSVLRRS